MKFSLKLTAILLLISGIISFIGCNTVENSGASGSGGGTGTAANLSYSLPSGISFNMKYVPGGTFPTGTDDAGGDQTISTPYWMAETEVTYELWYAVRTWARANGYTLNSNPGREGRFGTITAGTGTSPTGAKQEPVTTINWREAMVWCNALTEYYNANNGTDPDLDVVYYSDIAYTTPLRSADDANSVTYPNPGSQDDPCVKSTANGFRLPTSMEWECAARYKDGSSWTPGNCASGGTAAYTGNNATDYPNFNPFAWYGNSTSELDGNADTTKPVAGKTANALGIYDMSGNVFEWCFDSFNFGNLRMQRGGSWFDVTPFLQVGYVWWENTYSVGPLGNIGFRFSRTQ